jgi:excinuclease ABC subunit C
VARSVLAELGIEGAFDLAGIAKKDPDAGETQDKIYLPGRSNAVQFGRDRDLLLLLQHVRDEAHRCAVGFQRKRRKQRTLHSVFDDIQGIGPKRKALLLKRFGSIENLKSASLAEIQSVKGISRERAAAIKKALS